jgi:hypothetical protein
MEVSVPLLIIVCNKGREGSSSLYVKKTTEINLSSFLLISQMSESKVPSCN